ESRDVGDLEEQAGRLVRNATKRLIVAGGDGSIHEAVNGIVAAGGGSALGVIPTGTGNDFAKAAQVPLDWEAATRLLARRIADDAPPRPIDVGRMNHRYFANGAGIGLDAKVTRIARSYQWPVGDLVYLVAIFRAMIDGIATPEITIQSDAMQWQGPLTLASVSNGPWIGGMFHIAPMASNDDGLLELLIAGPVTRTRILRLLPKLMRGRHTDEPEIRHASVRRIEITASEPVPSHLDGEIQPLQTSFEFEVLPGAIRLL
ncbi:MAG: diacylglycerol/lipid kinase family protein, partial [Woeseiaceae bacterium]